MSAYHRSLLLHRLKGTFCRSDSSRLNLSPEDLGCLCKPNSQHLRLVQSSLQYLRAGHCVRLEARVGRGHAINCLLASVSVTNEPHIAR